MQTGRSAVSGMWCGDTPMKAQGTKDSVYVIEGRTANCRTALSLVSDARHLKREANWPFAGMVWFEMTVPLIARVGVPMPLEPGWTGVFCVIEVTNFE